MLKQLQAVGGPVSELFVLSAFQQDSHKLVLIIITIYPFNNKEILAKIYIFTALSCLEKLIKSDTLY